MSTIRCHCGAVNQSHYKKCLGCGSTIDGPSDLVGPKKLVENAIAQGRICSVLTYRDGSTPIQANLVFHDPEDAVECARILNAARKPEVVPTFVK
ncbi:hypothetical protein M0R72_00140 [Candidatus Pacearchaeota archaeon]|jgi:hypothetical protein|nr:hypothetical protein [Candidatus Pacearchaeota archaeon]